MAPRSTIRTDNLRISRTHPLISPDELEKQLPRTTAHEKTVVAARQEVADILHGRDDRLLVVVGPCSIHDPNSGLEYAQKLADVVDQYRDSLCIVMRVYFEKPRTTVGWKGLINDPGLDGSYRINDGIKTARRFLLDVASLSLPAATEFLDTTFGQYYTDLISLGAIGARTTESQVHRELASGLSMPVGFKNRTDGDVGVARDAILSARTGHSFPTLTKEGRPAILETSGNPDCFAILRGGSNGPNYAATAVESAAAVLSALPDAPRLLIDCSHDNSKKNYERQPFVVQDVCAQLKQGGSPICGVMIESHLEGGNQALGDPAALTYGQSITDGCVDWATTLELLNNLADAFANKN